LRKQDLLQAPLFRICPCPRCARLPLAAQRKFLLGYGPWASDLQKYNILCDLGHIAPALNPSEDTSQLLLSFLLSKRIFPFPCFTMSDQPTSRPTSSFPAPKANNNPFLPPQPRPVSIATDIPYVAPPAYPHGQNYPQTGTKSEFDSDGIEFLKPVDGEREEPTAFPNEKTAWNATLRLQDKEVAPVIADPYHPQSTRRNSIMTPNGAVGFQPPGPPPARPTRPPSSQISAPLPHNPAYHQRYVHGSSYHEPNVAATSYDQGANEAGLIAGKRPPIKTVTKVFKICCESRCYL
jgi:hypothetical protein